MTLQSYKAATPSDHSAVDPVTFEVLRNAVDSILDEMSLTIVRTAYSTIVRDAMDFATSIFDEKGELLAQGLSLPFHLGGMPDALAAVRRLFGHEFAPGDVFILNDPYEGGSHLPDIFMFRPVFAGGGVVGFTATTAHHTDIGGRVAGSNAADSTEIYQEGLRIPPMRLVRAGQPVVDVVRLIAANVRQPDKVLGDLRAQSTACMIGERRVLELIDEHGIETLRIYFREMLDYTERLTRAEIQLLPDGVFSFRDYLDDDGIDPGQIPIQVTLTIRGDELTVDLTGTSRQVRGAINATLSHTKSAIYVVIRSIMASHIPNNAGLFRPIRTVVPAGTVTNLVHPAACAARAITSYRVVDALLGALAQAIPDRVCAAGEGGNTFWTIAGTDERGREYILVEPMVGCWGGRPDRDGIDGIAPLGANIRNAPIERIESEYPVRVEHYGLVCDSGGPGRFRGGMSVSRSIRLLGSDATLQVRSERRKTLPYGLFGGHPGRPSENVILRGKRTTQLPSKFVRGLARGDVFRHRLPSAGGYGDPLDREPSRVLQDVLDEKVSPAGARRDYGVVVVRRGSSASVDVKATTLLRTAKRSTLKRAPAESA